MKFWSMSFNVYGELGYSGGKNITAPKVFKPLEGKKIVKIAGDLGENAVLMFFGCGRRSIFLEIGQ